MQDLEVSKVRSLEEVMAFMTDNAKLEFPPGIDDMRDFGRRRAIDKCLQDYDVDIILGPADSNMYDYYTAAGYPMASVPLLYSSFNKRPFGRCALASQYKEGDLVQFMSAWQEEFNLERVLPTWVNGDPDSKHEG